MGRRERRHRPPTADPTASFTARQVIDRYVADYQKGDYADAHMLFTAGIRASNTIDESSLDAQRYIRDYGPISTATIVSYADLGAEVNGVVRFDHTNPNGFEQYGFTIWRENGAWKMSRMG